MNGMEVSDDMLLELNRDLQQLTSPAQIFLLHKVTVAGMLLLNKFYKAAFGNGQQGFIHR
jgi:hypothetical protein